MNQYTPEQVEACIVAYRNGDLNYCRAGIIDLLTAYAATLRQAARVDDAVIRDVAYAIRNHRGDRGFYRGLADRLEAALSAQPAPTPAPDKHSTGMYHKFNVARTDGSDQPGGKHYGCEYFVLDLTHDPFAKPAAAAYAAACETEYPMLAADMRERYGLPAQPAERQGEAAPFGYLSRNVEPFGSRVPQWQFTHHKVEARGCTEAMPVFTHPAAPVGVPDELSLSYYDAGLLGDGGGGDVGWWHDYMRTELDHAHEFYQSQVDAAAPSAPQGVDRG